MSKAERRRWPVGTDPRRDRRREEAQARAKEYDERSLEDHLLLIELRPGDSARELARLGVR